MISLCRLALPLSPTRYRILGIGLLCLGVGSVGAQAVGVQSTVPAPVSAPVPAPQVTTPPPAVVAPSMMVTNLFDQERKVWPDRIPPPPPPAPPPTPAKVTDDDMQVYGVVITNQSRQATVRVGRRFANLAPAGRSFANVVEGQSLGEFTLAAIRPDHLVLSASGGEQRLYFTRKTDRSAGIAAAAAPVQGATAQSPESNVAVNGTPSPVPVLATPPGVTAATAAAAAAQGVTQLPNGGDGGNAAPAAATPFNLRNSLAAAIEAARNYPPRPETAPVNNQATPFQK